MTRSTTAAVSFLLTLLFTVLSPLHTRGAELNLEVVDLPSSGLLVNRVDLGPLLRYTEGEPDADWTLELFHEDHPISCQAVADPSDRTKYLLVARFPGELVARSQGEPLVCRLRVSPAPQAREFHEVKEIVTETPFYRITQTTDAQAGLPSRIEFRKTGRVLDSHRWFDRLHEPGRQGFDADSAVDVRLMLLDEGPICRIVRNEFRLHGSENGAALQGPRVVYTWFFFKDTPGLVYVTADYFQTAPLEWKERHFLELHVSDGSFAEYVDLKKPEERKTFTGTNESLYPKAAAILDGDNRLGFFGSPVNTVIYDGLNGFGPYLLANGTGAWMPWDQPRGRDAVWMLVDDGTTPTDEAALDAFARQSKPRISLPELDRQTENWLDVARNALFYAGILRTRKELDAFDPAAEFSHDKQFIVIRSANLGMLLQRVDTENDAGIRLVALVDIPSCTLLTPHETQSLFTVKVREAKPQKEGETPVFDVRTLTSDRGWKSVDIRRTVREGNLDGFLLSFRGPSACSQGESLELHLRIDSANVDTPGFDAASVPTDLPWYVSSSITLQWMPKPAWPEHLTLQSATLPTIRLAPFGDRMKGFFPQASGIVLDKLFAGERRWQGRYPSGWSTMPWYAVWNDADEKPGQVGIYVAAHDVDGTTKEQEFHVDTSTGTVHIALEYPAENAGRAEAAFAPCRVVLESYRGDWFDAAVMYRDWVRREASWFPREKLGPEGRTDTPLWMKELCVWAIGSDLPEAMPDVLRKFQQPLGVPAAVHWYNWHKIPFDNDYPHYFPVKDGFKAAVADIGKDGDLFVMPYINGRLWDHRDHGIEDRFFTKEAFPGVTKQEDGTPYFETYGSKESDGSNVELGVMCPASEVWVAKQRELISRLTGPSDGKADDEGNMGVHGVYVDQVAAAAPTLCFDPSHGHPLAGGSWWVLAYRKMFETIRAELPDGAMLTTECNAEPFIDQFDGYLTWHFQYDGQVPAFAAVYGGAVQMFGRHYGGGEDMVVACRMKLAESFVFGEQIGWITPHVVDDPRRYDFLKKVVALRYRFRDFFYKGEMARPPKLLGEMPTVTADWHFFGSTIVTTPIVRTGAWRQANPNRAILLFTNFSDREQENRLQVDLEELGFAPTTTTVVRHDADGMEKTLDGLPATISIGPEEAFILELR